MREAASGRYLREHVARLADWAASEDESVASEASAAIFRGIIEPLADSFEPAAVTTSNRVLAELIQRCRQTWQGSRFDEELTRFALLSEDDLFNRAQRLANAVRLQPLTNDEVRRAIVLSRVTLGADVAITSVFIERLKRELPLAEIVLLGEPKTEELFGGDSSLRFREIEYKRAGTAVGRLSSWLDALDCVREETDRAGEGECLIVDPDSRVSQLGLLPLGRSAASGDYLFFPSRSFGSETRHSLGELADEWLSGVFGPAPPVLPSVSLRRDDCETGRAIVRGLRNGARPIVCVNFGVGENPLKRISGEFESSLVMSLIQSGATVILDKGTGADEAGRAQSIIDEVSGARVGELPVRVVEADEPRVSVLLTPDSIDGARMFVWSGRIGLLAAMIGESDLYIGYDSAGQHIAAALGVPTIDVMAGFSSPRMLDRWRPTGPAEVRVVPVDTLTSTPDWRAVLSAAMQHARELLGG